MLSTSPKIEILGVWLSNKGAELMLYTVLTELGRRVPNASFILDTKASRQDTLKYGVKSKPKSRSQRFLAKLGPAFGFVSDDAITHFLDISGFAYGDYWGLKKAKNRLGRRVDRPGTRAFILPQAFGPFEDKDIAAEMKRICSKAHIVCARDNVSLGYLADIGVTDVELLPDITFLLDVSDRTPDRPESRFACLIPNAKLVDSDEMSFESQVDLYVQAGEKLQDAGIEPQVVLHEPKADRALGEAISSRLSTSIFDPDDARDLKALIGGSEAVVTSRFHGLVSALSTGVPVMAIGWSHKYHELLKDFGCAQLAYNGDTEVFFNTLNKHLCQEDARADLKARLQVPRDTAKKKMSEFFDRLGDIISN